MAATSATAQTYNATNVMGEVLRIGAANNTGKFLAAIGGLNGARKVSSQEFDMCAHNSLDTPSATTRLISENTSLSAGTARFYAKTPVKNVVQIWKDDVIVSDLRAASPAQIASSTFVGNVAVTAFDEEAAIKYEQLAADWETVCLSGTYVARSAVATNVAAGGLTDATFGITTSKIDASSATLDSDMVRQVMDAMFAAGANFTNMAIVGAGNYISDLNALYGFAPQSVDVGGVMLRQIYTTYCPVALIPTTAAPANTLLFVDLAKCQPVVMPHKGGQDILLKEYIDGASAQKGYVEGYIGIDFKHESFHGKIYGLA
jgi:hypothetical protein